MQRCKEKTMEQKIERLENVFCELSVLGDEVPKQISSQDIKTILKKYKILG